MSLIREVSLAVLRSHPKADLSKLETREQIAEEIRQLYLISASEGVKETFENATSTLNKLAIRLARNDDPETNLSIMEAGL